MYVSSVQIKYIFYFEHSIVTYSTEENDRGLKIIGLVEQKKICIDVPWNELIKINK
jgi:hypothetical protein